MSSFLAEAIEWTRMSRCPHSFSMRAKSASSSPGLRNIERREDRCFERFGQRLDMRPRLFIEVGDGDIGADFVGMPWRSHRRSNCRWRSRRSAPSCPSARACVPSSWTSVVSLFECTPFYGNFPEFRALHRNNRPPAKRKGACLAHDVVGTPDLARRMGHGLSSHARRQRGFAPAFFGAELSCTMNLGLPAANGRRPGRFDPSGKRETQWNANM